MGSEGLKGLVSVIIPAYNASQYIEKTVDSVINQTYKNFEIIIIYDLSPDNTQEIVERLGKSNDFIKVYLNNSSKRGVASARNMGVEMARGEFIAFLDSDDLWYPDKLEKQMEFAQLNSASFIYTAYDFIDNDGNPLNLKFEVKESVTFRGLLKQNIIAPSTVLIKTSLALEFPMSAEHLIEDFINWLEILKTGVKAYGINLPLCTYRLATNSRSANKLKLFKRNCKSLRYIGLGRFSSLWYTIIISVNSLRKYKKFSFSR